MTDEQVAELIALLTVVPRDPAFEVFIDVDFAHRIGMGSDAATANEGSPDRAALIAQGDRTAHVYQAGRETWFGIVTADQARRLRNAGATWRGPAHVPAP